jgi:hypothetical protein
VSSMRFKEIHRDDDRYYAVGVDEDTGAPVIIVTITSMAWRDIPFRLTEEEMDDFRRDPHALDDLAERLAQDKGAKFYTDRLLKP